MASARAGGDVLGQQDGRRVMGEERDAGGAELRGGHRREVSSGGPVVEGERTRAVAVHGVRGVLPFRAKAQAPEVAEGVADHGGDRIARVFNRWHLFNMLELDRKLNT
jgi:hypothetical protein